MGPASIRCALIYAVQVKRPEPARSRLRIAHHPQRQPQHRYTSAKKREPADHGAEAGAGTGRGRGMVECARRPCIGRAVAAGIISLVSRLRVAATMARIVK